MEQDDEEESTIKLLVDNISKDLLCKIITDNALYYNICIICWSRGHAGSAHAD